LVTAAAKLLKVAPKTVRAHIRRGLPMVDPASPRLRQAGGRIDLIVYGAWLNQALASGVEPQEEKRKAADSGASP
jgi:hypothetical protein